MLEPKDGDFVAYIDALQRESAARLAQHHGLVVATPHDAKAEAVRPVTTIDRAFGKDGQAARVKAVVAAVAGGVFLLNWLGNGGAFSFILAVALLVYAVPRLLAAFRGPPAAVSNKAIVDNVFGRSMPGTTGTKK
jgi:hypothetical protein